MHVFSGNAAFFMLIGFIFPAIIPENFLFQATIFFCFLTNKWEKVNKKEKSLLKGDFLLFF